MAFVRWRGNRATLLTTVYHQGSSRQIQRANLGDGYAVTPEIRTDVAAHFPTIRVDWEAVDRALAAGPPDERTEAGDGASRPRLQWLEVEGQLRRWAHMAQPQHPEHAAQLVAAADILARWRAGQPDFPLAQPLPGCAPDDPAADGAATLLPDGDT